MTAPDIALAQLGFTELESRLYCELLREAPATGYRLAQLVGKAPANTYQALRALVGKGAIVVNEGLDATTSYLPIPPDELLGGLKRAFDQRHDEARALLEGLHKPPAQEQVYQMNTVAQVTQRARSMIAGAREIILFDFFPPVYAMFADDLAAARARGVTVSGMVYDEAQITPTQPRVGELAYDVAENEPGGGVGLMLMLVVDGEQELLARLSDDKRQLLNGVWSDSAFLSCVYHSALASEIRLIALGAEVNDTLKGISLLRFKPPGLRAMQANADAM